MRSTVEIITSVHENRLSRMPAAISTALFCHNASLIAEVPLFRWTGFELSIKLARRAL
jgi:hypothetical protein